MEPQKFAIFWVDGFDFWGHAKFMKESVKRCAVLSLKPDPSLVFTYLRKPSCGARNMNVVGPPKYTFVAIMVACL